MRVSISTVPGHRALAGDLWRIYERALGVPRGRSRGRRFVRPGHVDSGRNKSRAGATKRGEKTKPPFSTLIVEQRKRRNDAPGAQAPERTADRARRNGARRPRCTVGCTGPPFSWRRNRGVITAGIHGNGDNACLERWGPQGLKQGGGRLRRTGPERRWGTLPRYEDVYVRVYGCLAFAYVRTEVLRGRPGFLIGRILPTECCTARPPRGTPFNQSRFDFESWTAHRLPRSLVIIRPFAYLPRDIRFRLIDSPAGTSDGSKFLEIGPRSRPLSPPPPRYSRAFSFTDSSRVLSIPPIIHALTLP